jgi:crotonobetainyl-CoA:carnitine CoA-transferase CaiB-like acyl-CoA transferase
MPGPLDGIRVVEATYFQNGPFAGVLLADLGADVIKIEPPVTGDPGRGMGTPGGPVNITTYYQAQNRTKRSITLDLQQPEAREVVHALVKTADVFLQNYRLGVAERLGIGYADLKAHNPDLIYASVTGLGREGPDRNLPVMDIIGLGRAGFLTMNLKDEDDEPVYFSGPGVADQVGATTMAYAILGALVHRLRTGEGQEIEVSQLGSVVMFENLGLQSFLNTGAHPRGIDRRNVRNPLWNTYPCGDGRWMAFAMSQGDRFWPPFCRAVEREDWLEEPRYRTMALRTDCAGELIAEMDAHFRTQPRDYWLERLGKAGLLAGPVNDFHGLREDPQVIANGYLAEIPGDFGQVVHAVANPVRYSATPVRRPAHAPELGQHTEEILLELGYDWDRIAALRERGAI